MPWCLQPCIVNAQKRRNPLPQHPGPAKAGVSRRTIPLPPELVHELRIWKLKFPKSELDLVFARKDGFPYHRTAVSKALDRAIGKGWDLTIGLLRTACATHLPACYWRTAYQSRRSRRYSGTKILTSHGRCMLTSSEKKAAQSMTWQRAFWPGAKMSPRMSPLRHLL